MIRKGDRFFTHREGSFTVVKVPRVWTRDDEVVLTSDDTGEERVYRVPSLFNALGNNYFHHHERKKRKR